MWSEQEILNQKTSCIIPNTTNNNEINSNCNNETNTK